MGTKDDSKTLNVSVQMENSLVTGINVTEAVQTSQEVEKKEKDKTSLITSLPMEDTSDAWMNDDLGTIDSDSDDERTNSNEKTSPPELAHEEIKPQITGLPMEDASDAWMNDDVGTIDSDFDDESGDAESDNKKNKPRESKTESTIQISKETSNEIKPQIAGLPMEDASDAWMNDDVETIDSDSDDESEDVKSDRKKNQPEESRTETEAEIT